jgi:hypothetical protein
MAKWKKPFLMSMRSSCFLPIQPTVGPGARVGVRLQPSNNIVGRDSGGRVIAMQGEPCPKGERFQAGESRINAGRATLSVRNYLVDSGARSQVMELNFLSKVRREQNAAPPGDIGGRCATICVDRAVFRARPNNRQGPILELVNTVLRESRKLRCRQVPQEEASRRARGR